MDTVNTSDRPVLYCQKINGQLASVSTLLHFARHGTRMEQLSITKYLLFLVKAKPVHMDDGLFLVGRNERYL